MTILELDKLTVHATTTLVETGRFPEEWLRNYEAALGVVQWIHKDSIWPKRLFASLHYASMHLGIRYRAWRSVTAMRNETSESMLAQIQLETEVLLWESVCGLDRRKGDEPVSNDEDRLIELCVGEASPVGQAGEEVALRLWRDAFEGCLDAIQCACSSNAMWPKWFCVAVHFAAFYLDLYLQRDVQLIRGANRHEHMTRRMAYRIDGLIDRLSDRIPNDRVLALIELWLYSCNAERDMSGLPDVGKMRPRCEQVVSVRTATELFVQQCVAAEGRTL